MNTADILRHAQCCSAMRSVAHGGLLLTLYALPASTSATAFSQESEYERAKQVHPENVSAIAIGINALTPDQLRNDHVIEQLVLLLDDNRIIERGPTSFNERVRGVAERTLWTVDPASVSVVIASLPRLKSNEGLTTALGLISRIAKPNAEAYGNLLVYCRHDDSVVRSRAIYALSAVAVDDDELITQLSEFLDDEDPLVRGTVLDCLGERPGKIGDLVPSIGRLLDDESDVYVGISDHFFVPQKLRGRAARILCAVGPAAAETLPKLKQLISEQHDVNVRVWSAAAICAISDPPPPETLELLGQLLLSDMDNEWTMNDAVDAIAELGPRAAPLLDQLERAKHHRSASVRWGVAKAFFEVAAHTAVERTLPLVHDEDELVAAIAIETLSAHGAGGPAVIDAYTRSLSAHDGLFDRPASSAVDALARLGPDAKDAVPALTALANDPEASDSLRESARLAIAAITEEKGSGAELVR